MLGYTSNFHSAFLSGFFLLKRSFMQVKFKWNSRCDILILLEILRTHVNLFQAIATKYGFSMYSSKSCIERNWRD